MSALFKYELFKIRKNNLVYAVLIICSFIAVLFCDSDYFIDPFIENTPYSLLGIAMNAVADIGVGIIIITGSFAAYLIGQIFSEKSVNTMILAGHKKICIYKICCIKTFLLVGSIILISIIAGCASNLGKVPVKIDYTDLLYIARTIILIYVLAFSIVSICILITMVFRDAVKSTVVSAIYLFLACYVMAALVAQNQTASGTISSGYIREPSWVLRLYPPYLWRWMLRPDLSLLDIFFSLAIATVWSIIFLSIGYRVFKKSEV